ncbi:hypothetical protein PHYBLDRAFT_152635 [Phycomyces blakesleeanus NRRL 1555(-)]|uniref:Uncharacterized protein n=1 Tax=Phycomyces blakesleeanus (strain ATCC 8743b / DSM 1359 / FGSC 10004 / NBRC 33097 / NRRL 1555) TaxID=763407 RepID=A0A163CXH1_PHYB8|nr:hypothetical protein PHYBLDRAFT_152635 [Phycomyces blakesleeanus NRRL 1555(-)]OAD66310.1 hypothetical protein PHYBLDRAFT_152635 [Phycomyces blakesleeanus NRRL 1555(-)]|eukprot:XP_018284350.1 hypothetical protein PHYBLDRAFT_152635 [Phycomyces blakesleeanus NRRL 1555(-)]
MLSETKVQYSHNLQSKGLKLEDINEHGGYANIDKIMAGSAFSSRTSFEVSSKIIRGEMSQYYLFPPRDGFSSEFIRQIENKSINEKPKPPGYEVGLLRKRAIPEVAPRPVQQSNEKVKVETHVKRSSNSIKRLSDSMLFNSMSISIPWCISLSNIRSILTNLTMPNPDKCVQNIHIIMDKHTGKTLDHAYIEVLSDKQTIVEAIKTYRRPPVKGRRLSLSESSQDDLMSDLYPGWKDSLGISSFKANGDDTNIQNQPGLIEREDYEALLAVCRDFKLHFSRKCAERPFEHFISLLIKYPWDQPQRITTLQRDHLYEYYKQATGILKEHLFRHQAIFDPTLLQRMVRGAIQSPGLTVPQKKGILKASLCVCPDDLSHLLVQKSPETTATEDSAPPFENSFFSIQI